MTRKKRLQFKDLDAMRFIAFVPIFMYCALFLMSSEDNAFVRDAGKALGYVKQNSLDFFFFLSAFLLTSHALREHKYTKAFSLKSFYIRRLMRILPVFALVLLFTFFLHPWIIKILDLTPITVPKAQSYILLFPNYFSELTSEQYIYLAIVWTIYMFIQFYVFWGFILKFFLQQIKYIGILLMVVGVVARVFHILSEKSFEFDTLSAGVPVGAGALIAHIVRNDERTIDLIKHLSKGTHAVVYLCGLVVLIAGYLFLGETYFAAIIPLLTCLFFGYAIIEQTYGKNSILKLRKKKILSKLGKISYGLIIYQSIIMVIGIISVDSLNLDMTSLGIQIAFVVLCFFMSWLAADVSYTFYERPIYSFKREFKRS